MEKERTTADEKDFLYKIQSEKVLKENKSRKIIAIIIFFIIGLYLFNIKNSLIHNHSFLSKKTDKINQISIEFFKELRKVLKDDEILENEIMSHHTTFRIGGPAKIFVKPKSAEQIIEIINLCNKHKVNYFILGNGSNLLVSDAGYNGVVIYIHENNFSNLNVQKEEENNYIVTVGGGMLMKTLSIEACLLSLKGLEDIIDIPGTIAGGIIMNASFRRAALKNPLQKVKVVTPEGILKELNKEECGLHRRGSVLKDKKYLVIEVTFKLKRGDKMDIQKKMTNNTKSRYTKQPMYFGSAGCFFIWERKKLGSMYEKYKEINLVSYRVGNAMVYTYNISFIVNLGKATAADVMEVVTHIEKIMKEKYGIQMKREVVTIGSFN